MTVGERIRHARTQAGMTLDELAKRCGTIRQTMYKYETGIVTNIPLYRIEKIAAATGVSAEWILGWDEKTATANGDGLTEAETALLKLFRAAPPEIRAAVLRVLGAEAPQAGARDGDGANG